MNKTVLVAGGTALVSLAAGATGGYFFAKRQFDQSIPGIIEAEIAATTAHYETRIAEMQEEPDEPGPETAPEDDEELQLEAEDPPTANVRQPAVESFIKRNAEEALVNYQGMSKPPLAEVVGQSSNVFDTNQVKPELPPRDDHGRFIPKQPEAPEDPFIISLEEWVENKPEHEQESLIYFMKDKTLMKPVEKMAVDLECVGETNLSVLVEMFSKNPEGAEICVRNPGLEEDYEVTVSDLDLTEWFGSGEHMGDSSREADADGVKWVV